MIKNIFITGKPGCGKTSLIMEILKKLNLDAGGFYTSEIRKNGQRIGFNIFSLNGKRGILARKDFKSQFKVSRYGVNIKDLEVIGVRSIEEAISQGKIIIIDEIGTMEMFSEKFKETVETALDSKNKILGTIKMTPNPFIDRIKKRKDTRIFYLTRENKEKIKKEIINLLESK